MFEGFVIRALNLSKLKILFSDDGDKKNVFGLIQQLDSFWHLTRVYLNLNKMSWAVIGHTTRKGQQGGNPQVGKTIGRLLKSENENMKNATSKLLKLKLQEKTI